MKKNILTIVIMACTVLNLVLNIIIIFSIVPASNKTNKLVDKVASVIDLELEKEEENDYDVINDLEEYEIKFDNKQTINLKQGDDGQSHYVILEGVSVSFNKEADDYSDISSSVKEKTSVYVVDCVKEAISEQTIQTLNETTVKELALAKIQELYNSKCIVGITLLGYMFQ